MTRRLVAPAGPETLLRAFGDVGLRYALLRQWEDRPEAAHPSKDADRSRTSRCEILVDPDALDELDATARRLGLVDVSALPDTRVLATSRGHGWRVVVRRRLRYGGRRGWLSTGEDEGRILRRAVGHGAVRIAADPDRLVHLVLHGLLSAGGFPDRARQDLTDLVGRLRADPTSAGRAAERVQVELAPAVDWGELLADIVRSRWDRLLARRHRLRWQLWLRSPVASGARLVGGGVRGSMPAVEIAGARVTSC